MRLRRLAASLSPEIAALIPPLELLGYKSTNQIVFTPPTIIQKHIHNSPSSSLFTYSTFTTLREACIEAEAGEVIEDAGETFLDDEEKMKDLHWDGFGIDGLDGLMVGFCGTGVVEVCGSKSVGKSLLILHVVLRHVVRDPLATCTWIDTEGAFSPERAAGILEAWHVTNVEEVLGRIELVTCFEVNEARSVIQTIGRELLLQSESDQAQVLGEVSADQRTNVIVVDCVTTLLAPLIIGHSVQGYSQLVGFMMELGSIVRQYNLLCLLTQSVTPSIPSNSTSSFSTTPIKPCLGTTFALYTDITLLVQMTRDVFVMDEEEKNTERRVVEVLKWKDGPAGTWTVFDTDGIQLFDVVPDVAMKSDETT